MPSMLLVIRKLAAPAALFLALFFFAGFSMGPVVSAFAVQVDQCCDKGVDPGAADTDGECVDCNCPICLNIILPHTVGVDPLVSSVLIHIGVVFDDISSDFIRAIDYPPESV